MNQSRNPLIDFCLFLSADRHIEIDLESNSQCGILGIHQFRFLLDV